MDTQSTERFRLLVETRWSSLLRTAYLLLGDRQQAEDLVQTALTKAYVAWGRIRELDAGEAYVRRTIATTAVSWWRRPRWRREHSTDVIPETPVGDETGSADERHAMWKTLRALPPKQRAVLVLRYYEDMSEAQIAEVLGVSVGSVKSYASRGLAALRLRLGRTEDPSGFPATEVHR